MTLNDKSGARETAEHTYGVRVAVDDYSQDKPVAMVGWSWPKLFVTAALSLWAFSWLVFFLTAVL
jgi:hypothetical protein